MKVFLAGATGAIGTRLVPLLVAAGHDVVGTTRTPAKIDGLRLAGATPVIVDGLDPAAVRRAVLEAKPEVVIHEMTSLAADFDLRHFARTFAITNRLRVEATDSLMAAAVEAGARRFIAQSYTGWTNAMGGAPVKDEDDPIPTNGPRATRATLDAIRHVETVTMGSTQIDGVVLRYGSLYGPGNTLGKGGATLQAVAAGKLPIVGTGAGIWSFVHVDDAAGATALAVDGGGPGLYNIVDDEPAPVAEWLSYLADAISAPAPKSVPVWLARALLREPGVSMMTRITGSSNAKAKRSLGWQLRYPSWRVGFRDGL
jgi:nucleoside-diphosphate-sugar epimerase